jgi:hypothetical protein
MLSMATKQQRLLSENCKADNGDIRLFDLYQTFINNPSLKFEET